MPLTYQDLKRKEYFDASKDFAASRLGIDFSHGNRAYCPFHHDSQDSFRIFISEKSEVRFHCFGVCGGDWDIYDLIMLKEKCGFAEAQSIFADFLGTEIIKYNRHQPQEPIQEEPDEPVIESNKEGLTDRHRQVMGEAAAFYHELLTANPEPFAKVLKYLFRRGLDLPVLERFQIGYCPPFNDEAYKGRAFLGHIQDQLNEDCQRFKYYRETGLLRLLDDETVSGHMYFRQQIDFTTGIWGRYADYFAGRITFPVRDIEGRIQGLLGRRPDNRGVRWMKQSGEGTLIRPKGWLYGLDKAARWIRDYQTVIVVEGIFDYFAFYNLAENKERPIVVSSLGVNLDHAAVKLLSELGAKYFIIAYDWDPAGRKGITEAVSRIEQGRVSYLGSLKEGEDPAECLKNVVGSLSSFGIRHLQKGMEIESPSGRPVMASFLVQRQEGKKTFSKEILFKASPPVSPGEVKAKDFEPGTLWYKASDFLPLLTYDHGNHAELTRKLTKIRALLDAPSEKAAVAKDDCFSLPVKFIEDEIHFRLEAALILHLRLAIEQRQRRRHIRKSDATIAKWLNTSRKTVQKYKAELRHLGLLNIDINGVQQILSVRYFSGIKDKPVTPSKAE